MIDRGGVGSVKMAISNPLTVVQRGVWGVGDGQVDILATKGQGQSFPDSTLAQVILFGCILATIHVRQRFVYVAYLTCNFEMRRISIKYILAQRTTLAPLY